MKKTLTVLGSTGSIGTQTLEAAEKLGLPVIALTANKNVKLLEAQARKFAPRAVALADAEAARELKTRLADTAVRVLSGMEGVLACAAMEADIVESSLVGVAGLLPTLAAIRAGNRRVALANKETLVCAGHIVKRELAAHGCELIPVDSEHSAIFQCLRAGERGEVKRILLTASGGPFRTLSKEELAAVTPVRALRHPNWDMGAKVTIDSASMMNKGLEVIEAMHLFDARPEQITVLVHPQSIVHSAVEFTDNAVIAQLGVPDMRLPIQLALTYPARCPSLTGELDLAAVGTLTFEKPDTDKFRCLKIALDAAPRQDAAPAVMNAANEVAVRAFLQEKIGFSAIPEIVERAVSDYGKAPADTVEDILSADALTRASIEV